MTEKLENHCEIWNLSAAVDRNSPDSGASA
jgi:hypothetical protein